MFFGLAVAFASQAADYTLDFRAATPVASEAPVLRKAEMPLAVGQIPSVAVGDAITLKLFEDVGFLLDVVSAPPAGIAGQSLIARDKNGSASAIVKVTKDSARISVDDFMNRRQFTVRCKDGKVLIGERDNSQVDDGECGTCGGEIEVPQTDVEETKTTSTKKSRTLLGASGDEFPLAEQKSVVDILVAFDQGAKAWAENGSNWGNGGDSIEEFADYAVNKMNTVLANSQLDDQFCYRLAGVVELDGTWTKIDNALLLSMRAREGKFAQLSQQREKYGADTITLLINRTSGNTSGIGFEYGTNSNTKVQYTPSQFDGMNYGCNVCDINTVYSRYTMSHETGHNMGCGHSNRQGKNSGPGRYSDSCGYHFTDGNNVRRSTVMAYTYAGDDNYYYDPVPYFSTHEISPTEYGCVLGVEGVNNNRRTLTLTHADIASLREHVMPYDWDVKFLDDNGKEIPDGAYFLSSCNVTLTHSNPDAEIYYTQDGSTPTSESNHCNPGDKITVYLYSPKTLTACAVTNGVAISKRSITLRDGLTWSGDANGYGVWTSNDSSKTPWSGKYFYNDPVVFPDLADIACATVMVQDAVSPGSVWFRACETAYLFEKGSDAAQINLPDAAFVPAGDVTFNVPVQLAATTFTNLTGHALTFNAPFGQTVDSSGGSFTGMVNIGPYGTLTVAPGAGKTQTLEKLNNIGWYANSSIFRVGEGTVVFNGSLVQNNKGTGVTGSTKLEVGNGGSLVFNQGGATGFDMNNTSLTVEKGGSVTFNDMEHLRRTLYLYGGAVYVKRFDLMSNPGVYVTDDSSIENNSGGYILIRSADSVINVSNGKTLTLNVGTQTDGRSDTSGWGIIKRGGGTLVANVEFSHSGVTDIEGGSLEVGYSSGTTTYGQGWIVASNATLKVKSGCSLKVPTLTLDPTATISVPAANTAPIIVNGNVDLTEVRIAMHDVSDLSLGASYPLISATGDISGLKSLVRASWPKPETGLGWKLKVANGTLTASIVNVVDADPVLDFITDNPSVRFSLPEDASMTENGSLQLNSSPIVLDGFTVNAIAATIDVTLGEPSATERTICSWKIGSNIVRCVVTNGVLDCFHAVSSHVNNSVPFIKLSPGRHVVNVAYKSLSDDTYGGTFVYVDGQLAYRAAGLRWSNDSVSRVTIGASAADTPAYKYEGLVVNGLALLTSSANEPLPNMTSSGGTVTYDYFAAKSPCVFSLAPSGGFSTHDTLVSAAFQGSYDEMSVSVVAAFPETSTGAILSPAVLDGYYIYSTQVEYQGNGVFAFRDNGGNNIKSSVQTDIDLSKSHLYTLTYKTDEGFRLYLDGDEILTNDDYFKNKSLPIYARMIFGCGYWTNWMTSYNDNPNPMPDFTVYASHIALGTSDRTESEAAVRAAVPVEEPEEPEEPEDPDPEPPETPAVVDVLVAYDNGAQAYVANKGVTLSEFAQTQIGKMNDVLVTNKLDRFYSYRLAGVCKVDATYANIEAVSGDLVSGAGPLVTLRSSRELYGADTVTLLVNTSGATLGDSIPLSSATDVASQHECAFSVCSISAVDTGAQHTMIHENAHNMGCGHSRRQDRINSPFDYGRGYYFMDGETKRHTIMAYDVDGTGIYAHPSPYFSTTSKDFGFELGDKTNNNARVLKETCSEVAKWRENGTQYGDELTVTDENGNVISSDCFFKTNLRVTVAAPIENAELYYTFNGSDPTLDNYLFSQPSPFTFNFTGDRTLKIAYYDGNKMSPVRTVNVCKCANVPADGLWQTSLKYPWTVDGDTIRSYNQTEYGNQCTTPLKTTIEGPKVLSFKHKSYFGGESVAGNNYSHFDVLLDDSPVLTQTECTNSWTDAQLIIPEGTHEVTFVFSQRFAMNNSGDYKDGTPEADDAVWLKDIALSEIPMCRHTSTSDNVTWTFPSDAVATSDCLGGIILADNGIKEALNFGSTNAVILSVLAELPEGKAGAFMGLLDKKDADSKYPVYAYSWGDGTVAVCYGNLTGTKDSVVSEELDIGGMHIWTLVYYYGGGAKLYMDGKEVASDIGIKWTGSNNNHVPSEYVTFGSAYANGSPVTGMKIYAVHSAFGYSDDVFNKVSSSVDKVLSSFDCLLGYADESQATKLALLRIYKDTGSVVGDAASECVLRISEIMPKPTDDRTLNGREGMDVNGLESGWVEVENTSDKWADLADYRFIRVNRGKKTDPAGVGNFPSRLVPPHGRAIFYTSERYSNSKDKKVSAFAEGTFDGKPMIFENYGNILVWGDKVNPKKSPYVRLYYAPEGDSDAGTVVDTVVVPSDLPEGWSIIVGDAAEGEGTRRWMCPTPTRGAANTATTGLTRIGPNVGPLYEKPDQKKTDLASEFAAITPPAVPGTDYTVTLAINAVMNPDGTFTPRAADQIHSVKFVYRKDLDDTTLVTNDINMASKTTDANWGDRYTATIPASFFPAAGHLMQWKVLITDGEGVEWTSPSFNNKDDGYEWYGTIVEPGELNSATLPTWHMFASGNHLTQMNVDADKQDLSLVPNQARVAIYDSSTSNYYDYVRIDLRGHTSANFTKKGHGLRFAKAHPLTMRDCVTGEEIEEIRKTSLISEFADPSFMRQMIAFWLWRKMGNLVPFDFPVRCNLNGEFYQLAFNSERFTDELIEDVYGLDKFGYSYKNVGTLKSGSGTTAGDIEKKTPDDEDESNITVLQSELRSKITAAQYVSGISSAALSSSTTEMTGLDNAELTKFVVQKFDLPAWLNYLASAKITQEMDDVWANICIYYDNPDMLDGARGTGTWMPLGYDFNISFGQYYQGDIGSKIGLMSDQDWFKSHPFYGGNRVRCWKQEGMTGTCNNGNDGFEAVWQSAKFRRLYLRRLRTLMDQELKEPGTLESEVPFMAKMREMADLMRADSELDLVRWPDDNSDNAIDIWPSGKRPGDMDAGIDEIWNDYVVPRRQHLYGTHSVTNTAKAIGYGSNLNAGIPEAQSPISVLAPNISIANLTALDAEQAEALGVTGQFYGTEVVVIRNDNDEVVDMSGWKLAFSVDFTFPAGTVCDANDSIYIVADRRTYIEAHDTELTDQVIVGNATFAGTGPIALYAADGTLVYAAIPQTNELRYLRLHSFYGNTLDGGDAGEWFTLTNISDSVTLDLADVTVCFLKQGDDHDTTDHCHVTLENKKGKGNVNPLKSWMAQQSDYADKGWLKIQNNKQLITIYDKYGSVCQSLKVTQKTFPLAYGNGGYLVCDSIAASVTKDSDWHEALYELANDGASSENFSAEDQAAANELVVNAKPVLSDDDIAAGLDAQYLTIVAEPVADEEGKYKAVVAVNPETVGAPVIAEPAAESEPVEIEEDDEGETTVSVSISNAVKGLWYGYEVADELGDASMFANDVPSFERATDAAHTVTGSPRDKSKTSGFFRLKVLPAKPSE